VTAAVPAWRSGGQRPRRRRRAGDRGIGGAGPRGFTGAKHGSTADTAVHAYHRGHGDAVPDGCRGPDPLCRERRSRERTVVLTSPWPESVYAFAPMWSSLAEHARLFAIDLPGFGASERRADLLSPQAMGGFLTSLIAEADLGRPHLVGPDVGTSAALLAAAGHPERIASVIVGTGGAAVPLQLGEPLASWVLDPDLDKYRRMDPRTIVGAAVDTIAGGVPDDIRADYLDCYDGDRFAESMRYVRRYPEELPVLAECCRRSRRP
jgi:pimeloyl-ACP methyl ester carboxylesterase